MAYSGHYLAKFGTLILCASRQTVATVFHDDFEFQDNNDNFDDIVAKVHRKPWAQPQCSTIALCERIVHLLEHTKAAAGGNHPGTNPSIIAFALCLLVRFRLEGKNVVHAKNSLIATSVYVAYKFLTDGGAIKIRDWTQALDMLGPLVELERNFLIVLGHNAWVCNSVYEQYVGRMEMLWGEALEKDTMPFPRFRSYLYQTALR